MALAGAVFSIDLLSGYGLYINGLELDAMAAVVIGGTQLTGGVGYVFGAVFGVLIEGLIQTLSIFQGNLSSWWTKITVGLLTLLFIVMQSAFASRSARKARLSASAAVDSRTAGSLNFPAKPITKGSETSQDRGIDVEPNNLARLSRNSLTPGTNKT